MKKHGISIFLLVLSILMISCKKDKGDEGTALVRVGKERILKDDYETFQKVLKMYPAEMGKYFPGTRSFITMIVETQALFQKGKRKLPIQKIKQSNDWQWKSRYFPAQLYVVEELGENMSLTDKEIEAYYETHKEEFKVEKPESEKAETENDTNVTETEETKSDSAIYRPIEEVRHDIIKELFWVKFPPDTSFFSTFENDTVDTTVMKQQWVRLARSNIYDFFIKRIYEKKYDKEFPDSVTKLYGENKLITPQDFEVILSWIPENNRVQYETPQGKQELIAWLVRWRLFSEYANETGFAENASVQQVLDWAWKINVANSYVEEDLSSGIKKAVSIDTAMAKYAYYDDFGAVEEPDTPKIEQKINSFIEQQVNYKVDSVIQKIRGNVGVEFLQSDWKDDKGSDPSKLLAEADSLRDIDSTNTAEKIYKTLSNDFAYTKEGMKATVELAKIQTEKGQYQQAIQNYRKYLVNGVDSSKICNTFFMVGFIYDEYMNKPGLAEMHYKWVLKNTPKCDLADDAEFMMLHLDEPMTSIEELQGEALRQGRKVDSFDSDSLDIPADTIEQS